ncbi:battenin-like [Tachypleus tridentatus]|uniref:battenin-like n=1 Tax=Tachypleus tridentatus TaxID=6853 RepID=UPI003FCEFD52
MSYLDKIQPLEWALDTQVFLWLCFCWILPSGMYLNTKRNTVPLFWHPVSHALAMDAFGQFMTSVPSLEATSITSPLTSWLCIIVSGDISIFSPSGMDSPFPLSVVCHTWLFDKEMFWKGTNLGIFTAVHSPAQCGFLSCNSERRNVVSTWSSGTGGAGVLGALSYAALTSAGLSSRRTLQVMLVIPVMTMLSFWVLIVHPSTTSLQKYFTKQENVELHQPLVPESSRNNSTVSVVPANNLRLGQKVRLIKPLLSYMIPLSLVYFAGYFINQGLYELIYFQDIWLSHKEQYRWYQVDYQVGVFISRSSVNIIQFRKLWVLPIFQFMNLVILLCEVYFTFFSHIWIMLTIVFFEGLLGGCAYVNTYYRISQEVESENREFSMGVSSVGDVIGIAAAGAVAFPVHDALCKLPLS